jgi:hypothetical protein
MIMKKQIVKIGLLALAVTFINVDANAQKKKKKNKKNKMEEVVQENFDLKKEVDSVSYAIGMNMATSIQKDFSEVNFEAFIEGIKAGMANDSSALIKQEEIQGIIGPYFQKKQAAAQAEMAKASEGVIEEGKNS